MAGGLPGGAVTGCKEILDLLDCQLTKSSDREKIAHPGPSTPTRFPPTPGSQHWRLSPTPMRAPAPTAIETLRRRLNEVFEEERVPWAGLWHLLRVSHFYNPVVASAPLREQQLAQNQIVKATAQVEASRDTSIGPPAMTIASSGGPLSSEAKVRLQLALSFAAEACAEALRLVSDAIGTSLIRLENSFERHFRDGTRAGAIPR
jgi:hypothetical protein